MLLRLFLVLYTIYNSFGNRFLIHLWSMHTILHICTFGVIFPVFSQTITPLGCDALQSSAHVHDLTASSIYTSGYIGSPWSRGTPPWSVFWSKECYIFPTVYSAIPENTTHAVQRHTSEYAIHSSNIANRNSYCKWIKLTRSLPLADLICSAVKSKQPSLVNYLWMYIRIFYFKLEQWWAIW